jgi:hypothetical protein
MPKQVSGIVRVYLPIRRSTRLIQGSRLHIANLVDENPSTGGENLTSFTACDDPQASPSEGGLPCWKETSSIFKDG